MTLFFSAIFGLVVGSFLNALIWRLKHGRSVFDGRSICPGCKKTLRPAELIPVLSFIIQRGRCRHCHKKISWQYPLVEFSLAVLFVFVTYFRLGNKLPPFATGQILFWLRDLFLVTVYLGIFVFDLRYYLIPDKFTMPALVIVFLLNWWLGFEVDNLAWAALLGFGFFFVQYVVSKGRWVGGGDIRLGALMGVTLGWPQILVALFFAYLSGSLVAMALVLLGRKGWKSQIPFGTFLSASTVFTLFWGESVLKWYLSIIGY